MERFIRSLEVLWRSERLLAERQLRLAVGRLQLNAIAALAAVSGLVLLDVAAFFALSPHWGDALAALAVAVINFVLAAVLVMYARSLKEGTEVEMVKEVRSMAVHDIEEDLAFAEAEILDFKDRVHKFLRHPLDALLPGLVGPLIAAIVRGLGSAKEQTDD